MSPLLQEAVMEERSYEVIDAGDGKFIKSWTSGVSFDEKSKQQMRNVARLPFIYKWVVAMPDVHTGIGATVGSVIPTSGAIIPAAVGVDIGCGMMAVRTTLNAGNLPENLRNVRSAIEQAVPHGRTDDGRKNDRGAWGELPDNVVSIWAELAKGYQAILSKHPKARGANAENHLATLGTGNHFIEVCLDEQDRVWFMLHSGSRGVGNRIGSYFIELAKEDMRKWFINLPDTDLSYFPQGTEHFKEYIEAVEWAQNFARCNRELMMQNILRAVKAVPEIPPFEAGVEAVNCHHNYVAWENHYGKNILVTRKGAVRARTGDLGIIPGSMGARSYIVRGLGNKESFESCSHGAGRTMSRTEAKRRFTVQEHVAATAGIECRKDEGVIDETPAAYKPIEAVMEAQKDLVEIVYTLHQVVCVKG